MEGRLLCCVAGRKGQEVLRGIRAAYPELPLLVCTRQDPGVQDGSGSEIQRFIASEGLETCAWSDVTKGTPWLGESRVDAILLVGWRYLVPERVLAALPDRVIVAHDSLLPRYRGFAPLPTALINGDDEVGVTIFLAEKEVDTGAIVYRGRVPVKPGDRIRDLIERITPLYVRGMVQVVSALVEDCLEGEPQDDAAATYSIWRDDADYFVDWNESADRIERTIRALGPPYAGARARIGDRVVVLDAAVEEDDLVFEERQPGKVWRLTEAGEPVVVCGVGMLRLTRVLEGGEDLIPMRRLRVRFE
jgi:methionyl-tRNA formyltransferase